MKRTIATIISICLCIGLCACGGDTEPTEVAKSAEAQKADELILAIGEVSLDKEPAILAAQAYYGTLTDSQKAQVENYDILTTAISSLDDLKNQEEYQQIYANAKECEDKLLFADAIVEYQKLPSDYLDVQQRLNVLIPLSTALGTWVCDNQMATTSKGSEWGALDKTFTFQLEEMENGAKFPVLEKGIVFAYDSEYYLFTTDVTSVIDGDVGNTFINAIQKCRFTPGRTLNDDGTYNFVATGSFGSFDSNWYSVTYRLRDDGKMEVTYEKENKPTGDVTTVTYTYSKAQ